MSEIRNNPNHKALVTMDPMQLAEALGIQLTGPSLELEELFHSGPQQAGIENIDNKNLRKTIQKTLKELFVVINRLEEMSIKNTQNGINVLVCDIETNLHGLIKAWLEFYKNKEKIRAIQELQGSTTWRKLKEEELTILLTVCENILSPIGHVGTIGVNTSRDENKKIIITLNGTTKTNNDIPKELDSYEAFRHNIVQQINSKRKEIIIKEIDTNLEKLEKQLETLKQYDQKQLSYPKRIWINIFGTSRTIKISDRLASAIAGVKASEYYKENYCGPSSNPIIMLRGAESLYTQFSYSDEELWEYHERYYKKIKELEITYRCKIKLEADNTSDGYKNGFVLCIEPNRNENGRDIDISSLII